MLLVYIDNVLVKFECQGHTLKFVVDESVAIVVGATSSEDFCKYLFLMTILFQQNTTSTNEYISVASQRQYRLSVSPCLSP